MDLQLRKLRKYKHLTQEQLASRVKGATFRKISAWERGETPIPLADAALIADVLECSLDELAGRDWDPADFADPGQTQLNDSYRLLNDDSKADLVKFAKSYAADPERRVVKEGQPGDSRKAS